MFKNSMKNSAAYAINRIVSIFDKISKLDMWPKEFHIKDVYSISNKLIFAVAGTINTNMNFGINMSNDDNKDKTSPIADIDVMALIYLLEIVNYKKANDDCDVHDACRHSFVKTADITHMLVVKNILEALIVSKNDAGLSMSEGRFSVDAGDGESATAILSDKSAGISMKYVKYLVSNASSGTPKLSQAAAVGMLLKALDKSFEYIDAGYSDVSMLRRSVDDIEAVERSTEVLALKIAMDCAEKALSEIPDNEIGAIVKQCVRSMIIGHSDILSRIYHEKSGNMVKELTKKRIMLMLDNAVEKSGLDVSVVSQVMENIQTNIGCMHKQIDSLDHESLFKDFNDMLHKSEHASLLKAFTGESLSASPKISDIPDSIMSGITTEAVYDDALNKKDSLDLFDYDKIFAAYAATLSDIDGDGSTKEREPVSEKENVSGSGKVDSKFFN